jgi:glycosyltransferase involved in cell wall biosynthesis
MTEPRIFMILPLREAFSRSGAGAVALTVAQYVSHSRLRETTQVLGSPTADPCDAQAFHAIHPQKRWWRRPTAAYAAACVAYIAEKAPEHIDVHNRVAIYLACAKRFPSAKLSLWLHNDPWTIRGAKTPTQRRRILKAGRVFCVSKWVRVRFLDGLSEGADNVFVLPNAIEIAPIREAAKEPLILYVGRIIPEKGADLLAKALAIALPQLPQWRALLIGGGRSPRRALGAYEQDVRAALAPLGEQAVFAGFLPHERVMEAFSRSAITVVPSLWEEPFGRTALEAMAAGCALIATRRGGLAEVVGDAALALDPPDVDRLASAIVSLARDDERRADLQRRSTERAARLFDIRDWSGRLDALRG